MPGGKNRELDQKIGGQKNGNSYSYGSYFGWLREHKTGCRGICAINEKWQGDPCHLAFEEDLRGGRMPLPLFSEGNLVVVQSFGDRAVAVLVSGVLALGRRGTLTLGEVATTAAARRADVGPHGRTRGLL